MRTYPEYLDIGPLHRAAGVLRLPGSKSISNRTLLLAALAEGVTDIQDLLASDDVDRMLEALEKLGIGLQRTGPDQLQVTGCAGSFPAKSARLFLGNAGTAIRPLTAVLALSVGHYTVSGIARMHERPIGDLIDALRGIGANIRYLENEGYPPLEILPSTIEVQGTVKVRGNVSSQFLTSLLMALPLIGEEVVIEVEGDLISKPYIEITLGQMALFGVHVERHGWRSFTIPAAQRYRSPGKVIVEGDASSASYFLAAGAIAGGPVRVEGVGIDSVQGDVAFADALAAMGAVITKGHNWIEARSPVSGKLKAFDLDLNAIPDAAMTLAVAALFADGPCTLRQIGSWRVKETDRLSAMATELRKVGAVVEEGADYLRVTPPAGGRLEANAFIRTYDDHRMAMCFALAVLGGVPLRIDDPGCVAKTFPDFFERFAQITAEDIPVIAIDGPSASGKGTVSQEVARALGFHMLDSGALYRLVAFAAIEHGLDLDDSLPLSRLAAELNVRFDGPVVTLDGEDVTLAIRAEPVSLAASRVAAIDGVRAALLERQRAFRHAPGLVADGRDMGSVVFPGAVLKVYLTASPYARAERRYKQLMEKGIHATLDALLQDINERDARDAERAVAPLQKCVDAIELDNTQLSIEQAVEQVLMWFEQAQKQVPSRSKSPVGWPQSR